MWGVWGVEWAQDGNQSNNNLVCWQRKFLMEKLHYLHQIFGKCETLKIIPWKAVDWRGDNNQIHIISLQQTVVIKEEQL